MLLVGGGQGIGKGTIGRVMRPIVGPENYIEPDNSEILKGRHAYLQQKVLCVVNELKIGDRIDVANSFKAVITEETLRVELKYINPFEIENVAGLLAFTNHRDALAVTEDDRRYFVYWSPAKMRAPGYYDKLHAFLDLRGQGNPKGTDWGAAVFYRFLLERNISGFNPNAAPPMTTAKRQAIEASRWEPLVILEEIYEECAPPFDREVIKLTSALEHLRLAKDGLHRLSLPKLTQFLREKGGGPLGDNTPVRYVHNGQPERARLSVVECFETVCGVN